MNGSLECEYRCYEIFEGKNKDYKKALNEGEVERPASFERRDNDRRERPGFKTERPGFNSDRPGFKSDRPERRFAAAHSNDEEERAAFAPGKPRKHAGKMRYEDDDDAFGRKRKFEKFDKKSDRPFKKPFKKRERGGYED